jgi:hypothetical protein
MVVAGNVEASANPATGGTAPPSALAAEPINAATKPAAGSGHQSLVELVRALARQAARALHGRPPSHSEQG